jgi:predicted chitinase
VSYLSNLNSEQLKNVDALINAMNDKGIRNKYTQAGILAIVSKESNFIPQAEKGYSGTSNSRIRDKFSRARNLSDAELNAIKQDDQKFFNLVYGKRYGNDGYGSWSGYKESWDLPFKDGNDGFRYRGRGYNQLTFKGNYKAVGEAIGRDLVKYPELLEKPQIASESMVMYFIGKMKGWDQRHAEHYNAEDINDFKTLDDAVLGMYHVNAGLGKPNYSKGDATSGGLKKSVDRVGDFYDYLKKKRSKKNITLIVLGFFLLAFLSFSTWYLIRSIRNKG